MKQRKIIHKFDNPFCFHGVPNPNLGFGFTHNVKVDTLKPLHYVFSAALILSVYNPTKEVMEKELK